MKSIVTVTKIAKATLNHLVYSRQSVSEGDADSDSSNKNNYLFTYYVSKY